MTLRPFFGECRAPRWILGVLLVVSTSAGAERITVGTVLIANPGLHDPNFYHTVVLLSHHSPDGTVGVVINRPTEHPLREVFSEDDTFSDRGDLLWEGGPVIRQGLLTLLRASGLRGEDVIEVLEDLGMLDTSDALEQIRRRSLASDRVRIYAGHAGWAPGQLEAEIDSGGWFLLPGRSEWVFDGQPETLWERLLEIARLPAT